ncbi:MAG TPA: MopE-related protein, partial [Polyangiaceae bacterium]|nr:MopE-related protein [Polyangiaceae bacterium]
MKTIGHLRFFKSAWLLAAIAMGQAVACSGAGGEAEEDVAEGASNLIEAPPGAGDRAAPEQESGSLDAMSDPAGAPPLPSGAGPQQLIGAAPGSMPSTGEDVAAGLLHTLFLRPNGTVWAWGSRSNGQTGTGVSSTPQTSPIQVQGLPAIKAIAAGGYHSLAVDENGFVYAWGQNSSGQLGLGTASSTHQGTPVQVPGLSNIKAVAAGEWHSMAMDAEGDIWVWGSNTYSQIGQGGSSGGNFPTPTKLTIQDGAAGIAAGAFHCLVVSKSGAVWSWGSNTYGQIGNGLSGQYSMMKVPYNVSLGGAVAVAVEGGRSHSLALLSNGTIMAWGENNEGQLGIGSKISKSLPQVVPGLTGIRQITAGSSFTLARNSSGAVWAWGTDSLGTLGDGDATSTGSTVPQAVPNLNALVISAGYSHVVALGTDCTVQTWGQNHYGQLGMSKTGPYTKSPASVLAWGRPTYEDVDQDGYGDQDAASGLESCVAPPGYAVNDDDCNDAEADVYPGATEICDGLDNNCAGDIDENNPGSGAACSTGQPGACGAGVTQCSGGSLVCNQNVQLSAEACDGLDNDCDGSVDEENPGGGAACSTGQPGVCGAGTEQCSGGSLVCVQNVAAAAEICDGI